MDVEIEAKFPGIEPSVLRKRLLAIKARRIHPEMLMRRKNFDYLDGRLEKIGGWIRVRDEGNQVTMCYKKLQDRTLHGTKEVGVTVSSFESACAFLEAIGFKAKSYQETKREKWIYERVEITIDTWPWVPSFVELEGPSETALKETAKLLDLDWSKAMHGSVETVYQMHYDFTEAEIDSWESITFVKEPTWLLAKKK